MMTKPQIEALPPSMAHLPIDPDRGYPVPWFVPWIDGVPEFRMGSHDKLMTALNQYRCWVCGRRHEPGRVTYVIGPMCGLNRVAPEPPSHLVCARYSARNCPFLAKPQMVRRGRDEIAAQGSSPGFMIERNPGVTLLWTCEPPLRVIPDGKGGMLFRVGDALAVEFWAQGRAATREEILHSVETGLPILAGTADEDGPAARKALHRMHERFLDLLDRMGPPPSPEAVGG